jgi:2-keto-4-pentenoate hydratase/2-oxohepta-3-ene-1,7-dioic acid hydratase in catechol pathway
MKFISFDDQKEPRRLGVLLQGEGSQALVADVDDLIAGYALPVSQQALFSARGIPVAQAGVSRWLQLGAAARRDFNNLVRERLASRPVVSVVEVALRAPVARPGKIVALGRNYADHAKETGLAPFEKPRIVSKLPSSVTDPGARVVKPSPVMKLDFEAELAVVIGDFAGKVDEVNALDCVAGYTALNDLSAREFQFDVSPAQTTFAKSMDGFCPLGPCVVTPDEIADPQALRVQSWVNGTLMQDAGTADMLFPVRTIIAYVTQFMTLEPGDVIATGTPAGIGAFRKPPQWLMAGDHVRVEVSGIGALDTYIG